MALLNEDRKFTYVNISEGKFRIKKDGEIETFNALDGTITKIEFTMDEFQGSIFEVAKIHLFDGSEKFILSMRTLSGYFRNFCNALKTGNPTAKIKIMPRSKIIDGKTQTTIFIEQYGIPLKHYSTKDMPRDLPKLEKIRFNSKDEWDSTKQIEYWKNWLLSISFSHELLTGPATDIKSTNKIQIRKPGEAPVTVEEEVPDASEVTEPLSDLPF